MLRLTMRHHYESTIVPATVQLKQHDPDPVSRDGKGTNARLVYVALFVKVNHCQQITMFSNLVTNVSS
jgi:hypothetical protein